jgi:antitoxin (DNA-binding transcriptional repressor) of toxin-antitoxin stability system
MRTLSLEEAVNGLGRWLERAIEGEDIRIRKGNAMVELRPVPPSAPLASTEPLSPREALRRLQAEARLTSEQAAQYLNEVQDERLAAEAHRPE